MIEEHEEGGGVKLELCEEFLIAMMIDLVDYLPQFGAMGLLQDFQDWLCERSYITEEAAERTDGEYGAREGDDMNIDVQDCEGCNDTSDAPQKQPPAKRKSRNSLPPDPGASKKWPDGMDDMGPYMGGDVNEN
jgi:hypothetical protein